MRTQERHPRQHRRPGPAGILHPPAQGRLRSPRRRRWLAAALAVLAAVAVGSLVVPRLRQPTEIVYAAEADAYVSTAHPRTNYGSTPTLRTDATPRIHSYLRFRLDGLSGRVVRARLRLWSSTGSLAGYSVRPASSTTWDEGAITVGRRPKAGAVVAKSGPFGPGSWSIADVTRLVRSSDEVSLVVTTRSTQAITFDSREGVHKPELVVQTARQSAAALAPGSALE